MKTKGLITITILVFILFGGYSEELKYLSAESASEEGSGYPRVALVLSGGAALGMAHIGVLEVIEELGIPVDIIAGNSMGALIGGLYACGYSPGDILRVSEKINWNRVFLDLNRSESVTSANAERDVLTLHLDDSGVFQDEGIVDDQRICSLLSNLTYRLSMVRDFDNLPIPFRTVAVDLNSGNEISIKDGILSEAMRASMGLPIVFNPIQAYGGYLVDGGVLNNIPVNLALEEDADIIIAVNVEYLPEKNTSEIRNSMDVADQTMRIVFNINSHVNEKSNIDINIVPDLEEFTRFDFQRYDELAEKGKQAALANYKELSDLAEEISKYRLLEKKDPERTGSYFSLPVPEFDRVIFKNEDAGHDSLEANLLKKITGDSLNIGSVENYMVEINRRGNYRSLLYYLEPEDGTADDPGSDERILFVSGTISEKGQHELSMGIYFDLETGTATNMTGDGYLELLLRDLTGPESAFEARADLKFNKGGEFDLSYYQPIISSLGFRPSFTGLFLLSSVNSFYGDRELEDYQKISLGGDFCYNYRDFFDLYLGYRFDGEWYNNLGSIEEISLGLENDGQIWSFDQVVHGGIDWHFRKNSTYSRFGVEGKAFFDLNIPYVSEEPVFKKLETDNLFYYTPEFDESIFVDFNAGLYRGNVENSWTMYSCGGGGGIPGYAAMVDEGHDKIIAGFGYRKKIERVSEIIGLETYTDSVIRIGNVWDRLEEFKDLKNLKAGTGSGLMIKTPVGDLSAGMGVAFEGAFAFYFRFNTGQ